MNWRKWLQHCCAFKQPKGSATITPPAGAKLDFRHAAARLTGVSLDQVDAADFAEKGAVQARDRVRQAGERAEARVKDSPVMRAVNDAAQQIASSRSGSDDA